ncbi:hypothetical protein [uncultured Thiothrix sp.]|uniref:hypothetical protein n=1 Tax=uncultured Thiothrix sp. TaxID=223185 RepID=UPI002634C9BF|nr:hypothetical protein [uncultured Thiothrix sp.]
MIKHYTLIAAILALVLIGLFIWWFQGSLVFNSVYIAAAALATLSVPLLYRLLGYSLADDAEWLKNRENQQHTELMQRLQGVTKDLEELGLKEGVRQANALTDIIDDYHAVVKSRFFGKQASPLTYLSAARTVQNQAIQNLADMVTVGHSMSSIQNNLQAGGDQKNSRYLEQSERIATLLDENKQLFSALTETAVEVANMQSISEFERTDTLARLLALAEIANGSGKK